MYSGQSPTHDDESEESSVQADDLTTRNNSATTTSLSSYIIEYPSYDDETSFEDDEEQVDLTYDQEAIDFAYEEDEETFRKVVSDSANTDTDSRIKTYDEEEENNFMDIILAYEENERKQTDDIPQPIESQIHNPLNINEVSLDNIILNEDEGSTQIEIIHLDDPNSDRLDRSIPLVKSNNYLISVLPETCDRKGYFLELPTDVLLVIMNYLTHKEHLTLSLVNRETMQLAAQDTFWRDQYLKFVQSKTIYKNRSLLTFVPELRFIEPCNYRTHLVKSMRKTKRFLARTEAEQYHRKWRSALLLFSLVIGPALIAICFIISTVLFGLHFDSIIAPSDATLGLVFIPMIAAVVFYLLSIVSLLTRETMFFKHGFYDRIHFFHFISISFLPFPIFFGVFLSGIKLLLFSKPKLMWTYFGIPCLLLTASIYFPMFAVTLYKSIQKRISFDEIVYDVENYMELQRDLRRKQLSKPTDTSFDMNSVIRFDKLMFESVDEIEENQYDTLEYNSSDTDQNTNQFPIAAVNSNIRNRLMRYKRAEEYSRSKHLLFDFKKHDHSVKSLDSSEGYSDEESEPEEDMSDQSTSPPSKEEDTNLEVKLMQDSQRKDRIALFVLYVCLGLLLLCVSLSMITVPLKLDGSIRAPWSMAFIPLWVFIALLMFGIPLYLLFGILTDIPPRRLMDFSHRLNKKKGIGEESGLTYIAFVAVPFVLAFPGFVVLVLFVLKLDNITPNLPLTAGCVVLAIWELLITCVYLIIALPFSLLSNGIV